MMPLPHLAATVAICAAIPPDAGRITARDLAAVEPAFAALPAELSLGYAPVPGATRVFTPGELARLAARYGVSGFGVREICAERPTGPAVAARIRDAMRNALPEAEIAIVEHARAAVPTGGTYVFPASTLVLQGADGVALWRGYAGYGGTQRVPLWARVRVAVSRTRVIAAEPIARGKLVEAGQVRVQTAREFPGRDSIVRSVEEAAGRVARRSVAAGAALRAEWLEFPPLISRGELVSVDARAGDARIELRARAEANGRAGECIRLRNPDTRRTFFARVEGKGRATALGSAKP